MKFTAKGLAKVLFGIGGLAALFLLFLLLRDMGCNPKETSDWQTLGAFGESMAAVAVILALAAGIIAYDTLIAQKQEINTTTTRFESEQKLSQRLNSQNAFENGFFTLLNRQREIAANYVSDDARNNLGIFEQGQRAFKTTWADFRENYNRLKTQNIDGSKNNPQQALSMAREIIDKKHPSIRHYYRSLYQLVKYVDDFASTETAANFHPKISLI